MFERDLRLWAKVEKFVCSCPLACSRISEVPISIRMIMRRGMKFDSSGLCVFSH